MNATCNGNKKVTSYHPHKEVKHVEHPYKERSQQNYTKNMLKNSPQKKQLRPTQLVVTVDIELR